MITFEQAVAYNDRLRWDCDFSPFRSRIIEPEGYSILSGLRWAMEEVEVPNLIIMPWGVADVFLWHHRDEFNHPEKHGLPANWPATEEYKFRSFRQSGDFEARTWGFIGSYHGVPVLASGNTDNVWVTSERDAKLIKGDNTFFLKVAGRSV